MTVRLMVRQRSEAGAGDKPNELLLEDDPITLGRDKSCQVVLPQSAVSRQHTRISRDGQLYFVEDLGSAYGTQVNGQNLPKGEKRLLRTADVIAIAQFDVTFERIVELPKSTPGKSDRTAFVAREAVRGVMRGLAGPAEGPYFRYMNGPHEGERLEIASAQEIVLGRDGSADVTLKDDLVSRRHAKIRRDWSGTHVEDLESRNGIRVNRRKVNRKTLKDKDELEVGATRLLYLDPEAQEDSSPPELSSASQIEPTNHEVEDAPAPEPVPETAPEAVAQAPEEPAPEALDAGKEDAPAEQPPEDVDAAQEGDDVLAEGDGDGDEDAAMDAPERQKRMITLGLMGALALVAVVVLILVFVGA